MTSKKNTRRRRVIQRKLPTDNPKPSKDWAVEEGRARYYLERAKRKIEGV